MNPWEVPYDEVTNNVAPAAPAAMPWEVKYQEPSMMSKVGDAIQNSDFYKSQEQRGANLANIVDANVKQGDSYIPSAIVQGGMNEVGTLGDVLAAPVVAGAKGLYNSLGPTAKGQADAIGKYIGDKVAPIAQQYQQNQDAYNKENPNLGRDFQAVRELAGVLPLGNKGVVDAAEEGLVGAANAAKNVAGDTVNAIGDIRKKPVNIPASDLKAISQDSYNEADKLGGVRTPQIRNDLIANLEGALPNGEDIKPGTSIIQGVLDKAKTNAGYIKDKEGNWLSPTTERPLNLAGAETIDKNLTDLISGEYDAKGHVTNEGRLLQDAQSKFRDSLYNPKPEDIVGGQEGFDAYGRAVQQYAAARRMEDIENIFKRSEGRDNAATILKNGFTTLYNSPSRMRGYTPEEQAFIKKAATSGVVGDYLRTTAGSRLIGSGLGTAIGAATGSGPIGAAVGAGVGAGIAAAARKVSLGLQTGRTNGIKQAIIGRAVDNGTMKGTLYKYLGKEEGDKAFEALSNGQIPSSIGRLPSKDAKAIINSVKGNKQ